MWGQVQSFFRPEVPWNTGAIEGESPVREKRKIDSGGRVPFPDSGVGIWGSSISKSKHKPWPIAKEVR